MHILIMPSWYPTRHNAVSGVFFREQAHALRRAGHQVGVVSQEYHSVLRTIQEGLLPSISVDVDQGLPVFRATQVKISPKGSYLYRKMLEVLQVVAYQRYEREYGRPDLINAHSLFYGGYLAVQIKRRRSIPIVLTEHSSEFQRSIFNRVQQKIVKSTLKEFDVVCAVSRSLANVLQGYMPGKTIHVVGNLTDTEFFIHLPGWPVAHRPFIFAAVAVLRQVKGIDLLIAAFSKIDGLSEARLVIAGDGPELPGLVQLAARLGVEDRVEFLGACSREQTRDLLQTAHCLVSSSYIETFGITLIEALACGKPVISTRSGGPQDILNEANGLLVPVGDVAALAGALETMMVTYDRYNPEAIRADCLARFSAQAVVSRLEQIYRSLV